MTRVTKIIKLTRPFVVGMFTVTACIMFAFGSLEPRELIPIVSLIIGYLFGERAALKRPESPESE